MRCDIIMPVWNQLSFTRDCVDSIARHTSGDCRLIIIDNASGDETRIYLEGLKGLKYPPVLLVRNEENAGFVKAVNKAIAMSKEPYICVLNNDTIVTKDWLEIMMEVAESRDDIGIVNPSSNNLGQRPAGGEPMELYAERLSKNRANFIELGAAIGFCMLVKRKVIDKIGLFDEIYGMGNFEDTDFSRRAVKEAFMCVRACGAYVYHREGVSFSGVRTFEDDYKRNREIYEFRWGRPRRVAYILDSYDDNVLRKLKSDSVKLARGGNWVWYFTRGHLDLPAHSNITPVELSGGKFRMSAVFRILKKKKRFDEIFVGEERFGRLLEALWFIHRAKISYY